MLMEDGFSYTKSELQAGDQSSVRGGSSSSTGSESDELTASLVEKNANQARKGARVIENRMNYFKKHLKLLRMEGGKIVDPFRHHLFQTLGAEAKNIKMDWKEAGLARHSFSTPKQQSMLLTDRRESGLLRHKSPVKMTGRSVSTAEFHFALDQLVHSKGSEELERKLAQYEVIRTKRLLTIEKLYEYMEMLENKQQQRLIEEHRTSFRSFKYAGPSREGALFCLREKYRRERKAMRVKYAKKYGLLCRQVRLEKRLMRKAKRLLTRERILNLLKEKSRSKLILLMEMKYEFKKLVEKLKLNKELQEKIRRQDRLSNKSGEKKDPKAQKETETRKSMFTGARQTTNLETAEVQKSPITRGKSCSNSSLSVIKLPPLPCPPSTSNASSSVKLPPIKPLSKDRITLKAPRASRTDLRCPPLVHDKKLGAGKSQTGSSSLSDKVSIYKSTSQNPTSKVSKARMAKSAHRELPLINEVKYGALPSEEIRKGISTTKDESVKKIDDCSDPRLHGNTEKDSIQYLLKKEQRIESNLQRGKREADELSRVKGVRHLPSEKDLLSQNQNQVTEEKSVKQRTSKTHQQKSITKLAPYFDVTKFPNRRLLPGGLVRRSDIDRIPRYKYKSEDTQNVLDFFQSIYQKFVEDDLKVTFGTSRSESFVNSIIKDIKGMADFIFGHLHLFSLEEAAMVEKALKDFADTRLDSFMKMAQGYRLLINDSAFFGEKRHAIKLKKDMAVAELGKGYKGYVMDTMQRRIDYRADKTLKGRTNKVADESNVISKKKKRKSLADKLLLRRGHQFNNPVRVTTKLGGKLMLQGWKTSSFEEYVTIGGKIDVEKSGWRKDGMEHYEVIIPREPVDDLKYLLILNRLDLTPRRFSYPGYKFNSHIVYMYKYCSSFYRSCLLKRGERKTDKRRASFQDSYTKARFLFTGGLLQGEFRVPHLRHRIFSTPPNALHTAKPKDRNTPLVFSKRDEIVDEDDEPKKLRIQLQETETLNLWSYESTVAYRGTEEAQIYTKFARRMNKYSSRFHRCFEAETQTELLNNIDRSTQIYAPCTDTKSTNVYETDIMKASEDLPPPAVKSIKRPGFQEDDVSDPSTVCSVSSVESFPDENRKIMTSSEFLSKIRLTLRIMDSMIYSENQMTFRRGLDMDPLDPKAEISYSHERLFSFIDKRIALSEYVVTTMDWSSLNPNLLAVGYSRHPLYPEQDKGMICIWNIKMITKYERKFEFKNGVTYLQFCVPHPRLLNVALLDGSVLILDLGAKRNLVVTTKLSCVFSDYKPVWQFSWIELEKDHFLPITCGDNGFIHQLRPDGTFQHSKFLSLGHREGKVKGIKMSSSMGLKPRLRGRPGITCLVKHPTDPVLYLVGTTDGCVHICSIYFRNQHLDVFSAHIGAVKGIQFHPHCEHVFLTYGEDFYVRVWLYGTFEPALELMAGNFYVRAARWSPINPEILVSISNKHVDVWDIRRKTDTPIHRFMNPRKIENTALIFDKSGRNIVLGNIGGDVYVYALKNMPFTHYFNGEAIASALEKVLKAKKKFVRDIRKLGYPFGAKKEQPL